MTEIQTHKIEKLQRRINKHLKKIRKLTATQRKLKRKQQENKYSMFIRVEVDINRLAISSDLVSKLNLKIDDHVSVDFCKKERKMALLTNSELKYRLRKGSGRSLRFSSVKLIEEMIKTFDLQDFNNSIYLYVTPDPITNKHEVFEVKAK